MHCVLRPRSLRLSIGSSSSSFLHLQAQPTSAHNQLTRSSLSLCSFNSSSNAPSQSKLDEYGIPAPPLEPLTRRYGKASSGTSRLTKSMPTAPPSPPVDPSDPPTPHSNESPSSITQSKPSLKPVECEAHKTVLEKTVLRDMARFPDCIVLTQVGTFFESYFEPQAPLVAKVTGIKLTTKLFGKGDRKHREPFCGFPVGQLAKYLPTLVDAGHKVVLIEESKDSRGNIDRKVTRIVTPGTGVDDAFVRQDEVNFVLAVGVRKMSGIDGKDERGDGKGTGIVDLAYRDISTGSSFTRQSSLAQLRDDILIVEPREVVVADSLHKSAFGKQVLEVLQAEEQREKWIMSRAPKVKEDASGDVVLDSYITSTLRTAKLPSTPTTEVDASRFLQMDSATLKSLEIRDSLRGGVRGSLVSTVRRTVTAGGARLLVERLCNPSTEIGEIDRRLSLVSAFLNSPGSRQYLRALLKPLQDTSRSLQKLSLRRGTATDLLDLKKTLDVVLETRRTIEDELDGKSEEETVALEELMSRMRSHDDLRRKIEGAIDEDALAVRLREAERRASLAETVGVEAAAKQVDEELGGSLTEGQWGRNQDWVIKPDYNKQLIALHQDLIQSRTAASTLEKSLQSKYDAKNLSLKFVPKTGAVIHFVIRDGTAEVDQDTKLVLAGKSSSTRMYLLTEWTALYTGIRETIRKIELVENGLVQALVDDAVEHYVSLRETISALDELDLSLGFAELAREMELVKPVLNNSTELNIIGGRHPSVQHALKLKGRPFVSNSINFSPPNSFVHCITGPNMAGKSTYLRQNALIVVLAQAGSFVPAESATIGIVDRVFSRVGARDELDRDRSTFFIEMDEATTILNGATEKSLVLFDELGRGTSPLDGLAIAFAALEHLVHVNKSRTLFATHYHRLGELMGYAESTHRGQESFSGVEFWCTDVQEEDNTVAYSHSLRRGLNSDSAGLIIARLAGMPDRAVRVAQEIRDRFRP
ncbi:hypothetical protein T439DRAFT_311397 [Meredithblackwellia eburnea MCA 4105]